MTLWTIDGLEVIRLGDSTTHGGKVTSASSSVFYEGIQIARVGDFVSCPKCSGTHTIVSGAPTAFNGQNIAVHGSKVSCGATLLSQENSTPELLMNLNEQNESLLRQLIGLFSAAQETTTVALIEPLYLASVDINLTDAGTDAWSRDPLYGALEKLEPPKKEFKKAFSIGAHMYPDSKNYIYNINKETSPIGLASIIRNHPKYKKDQSVVLYACYAGQEREGGKVSFAQILATELQVNVWAAAGIVEVDYQTGKVTLPDGVKWELFFPESIGIRDKRRENFKKFLEKLDEMRRQGSDIPPVE